MDDVSRPEVGPLSERLIMEHGRRLPNLVDNSSHGPQTRPASHGDERHRDSSPGTQELDSRIMALVLVSRV